MVVRWGRRGSVSVGAKGGARGKEEEGGVVYFWRIRRRWDGEVMGMRGGGVGWIDLWRLVGWGVLAWIFFESLVYGDRGG